MSDRNNQDHISALWRRANYLRDNKLSRSGDYNGKLYDQNEYRALVWALEELGAPGTSDDREDQPPLREEYKRPCSYGRVDNRGGQFMPRASRYVSD